VSAVECLLPFGWWRKQQQNKTQRGWLHRIQYIQWVEKNCHYNFDKCWPIFNIYPLLYSEKNAKKNPCHIGHHTLDVSLHYLECKRMKLAQFCCTCLMLIKLTNKTCKTTLCIIGVKLNARKVLLSHKFTRRDICAKHQLRYRWCFAWNDARHLVLVLVQ